MTTSAERFGDGFGGQAMWGLQELAYPEPPPLLPQTPGWAGVGVLLLLGAGYLAWRARQRRRANAYRREALAALEHMSADSAAGLPAVLRRAALAVGERAVVASLRGEAWIGWLNARAPAPLFQVRDAALLDQLAYGTEPVPEADVRRLMEAGRQWLRQHRA